MKIAIIGGDRRMIHTGHLFEKEGFQCLYYGFDGNMGIKTEKSLKDALLPSDTVILPIPCEKNGFLNTPLWKEKILFEEILTIGKEKPIFGGMAEKYPLITDYSKGESFQLYNSVPTAEGALALAINHTDKTLFGMEITVIGFGRIGSYLSNLLKHFGAKVTVVSRSLDSRTRAEISGFYAVGFEEIHLPLKKAELIFNTVPVTILEDRETSFLKKGTPIIDLASFPFGVDEDLCQNQGIKLIRASGLPGKTAIASAGEIIFRTLLSLFKERNLI